MEYADRPLEEFLSEPRIALLTDSVVTRMLLGPDRRIPEREFIRPSDIEGLASEAIAVLDELGCVSVLELGTHWDELSSFFDLELEPVRINVTRDFEPRPDSLPVPGPAAERTLSLLRQRTAADALVFRQVLIRRELTPESAESLAETAFERQLSEFEDATLQPQ